MKLRSVSMLLLPLCLSACVGAGLALPMRSGEAEPFEEDKLGFIEVGISSKHDIDTAMSAFAMETLDGEFDAELKPLQFRDGEVWLYGQVRGEQRWVWVVWAAFIVPGGGASEIWTGVSDTSDYRYLLIEFDDNGVVTGFHASKSEGRGCNDAGICARGPALMLLASAEEDLEARQFSAPQDQCGVYLYGKSIETGSPLWLDGKRDGWLLDRRTYLYWRLEPGFHWFDAQSPDSRLRDSASFDCAAGQLLFFEMTHRGRLEWDLRISFQRRGEDEGREAISKRKRLLSASHFPEPQ